MSILTHLHKLLLEDEDFRDGHAAPRADHDSVEDKMENGGDFSLREVVQGYHNQPDDYFDPKLGPRYYMYKDTEGMQAYSAIDNVRRALKNGIDRNIIAYRAVPNDVPINKLIPGDWVSFSKNYAINHGESRFGEDEYKIIEQEVTPDEVWWDGNDIREWGYDPR